MFKVKYKDIERIRKFIQKIHKVCFIAFDLSSERV